MKTPKTPVTRASIQMKYSLVRTSSSHMVRTAGEDDDAGEQQQGGVQALDPTW